MGVNGSKDVSSSRPSARSGLFGSTRHENKPPERVDFGTVFPNGLYSTTPQDFDARVLRQLILTKKLSPFYEGLPEALDQVTATSAETLQHKDRRPRNTCNQNDSVPAEKESVDQLHMLYRDAVECPICFLYYPSNINYSRCCDQPICTECFIQIHRPTDDPSQPATCPFCLESNYGVIYTAPAWHEQPSIPTTTDKGSTRHTTSGVSEDFTPRRQSITHTHPHVVLTDHIRPHWNKPIPTRSSRRLTGDQSRLPTARPSRSASSVDYDQYVANMRDMNLDLEEWMVTEAIRLSLAEQQQQEEQHTST